MRLWINGKTLTASLDKRYADTQIGHAVIVLGGDVVVEPSFAALHDYAIVEATDEERQALKVAGYDLPDWKGE